MMHVCTGPITELPGPPAIDIFREWQKRYPLASGPKTSEVSPPTAHLQPKCAELPGQCLDENHAACWEEIAGRSGCYWWNDHYHSDRTTRWSGPCRSGIDQGRGTLSSPSGSEHASYEGPGTLVNGKERGQWIEEWPEEGVWSGSRYEGGFRDGKRHCRGTSTWAHGSRYDGQWRNGKPHGHGTYVAEFGRRYEGRWRDGCFGSRGHRWAALMTAASACGFE